MTILTKNNPVKSEKGWAPAGLIQIGLSSDGVTPQLVGFNSGGGHDEPMYFATEEEAKVWMQANYMNCV